VAVSRKIRPKFKLGDVVMLRDDAASLKSEIPLFDTMAEWKGRRMTVKQCDQYVLFYENKYFWSPIWFKLVEKAKKPKFKVGDWVRLKDNFLRDNFITSTDQINKFAYLPFHPEMHLWTNRFMKIIASDMSTQGFIYYVKENKMPWGESWFEKIE
jgi:hypothetical protein